MIRAETGRTRRSTTELLADAKNQQRRALDRLEKKNARVGKLEAQNRQRERKLDTRRKIIAGALALEHMQYDATFAAAFLAVLDEYVTKLPERALFGLPIRDPTTGSATTSHSDQAPSRASGDRT